MFEQTETQIRVESEAEVPAADLFAVLSDPRRHVELDGSEMLQASVGTEPIAAVGDVFTMGMRYPSLGDYRTDNHVVEFEPGRRVAWTTAREGQVPAGVRWTWELVPVSPERTRIIHTYDWSRVSDPAVLARVSFPRVSGEALEQSIEGLVRCATAG